MAQYGGGQRSSDFHRGHIMVPRITNVGDIQRLRDNLFQFVYNKTSGRLFLGAKSSKMFPYGIGTTANSNDPVSVRLSPLPFLRIFILIFLLFFLFFRLLSCHPRRRWSRTAASRRKRNWLIMWRSWTCSTMRLTCVFFCIFVFYIIYLYFNSFLGPHDQGGGRAHQGWGDQPQPRSVPAHRLHSTRLWNVDAYHGGYVLLFLT